VFLDEPQGGIGDLAPPSIDRQRVARAGDLHDLRHSSVSLLALEGRFSRLKDAFAIDQGTVWSCSREMISIGPRFGFFVFTLSSVHGFRLAAAAWKSGSPGAGTQKVSYSCFASPSLTAFGERVLELLEREWDGAVAITGIPQHRRSGPEGGDGQRQDTAERCRRDRDRNLGQPSTGQDLRHQPAERVSDDGGLLLESPDDLVVVVRHVLDRLLGHDLRVLPRLGHGVRIVRPPRGKCRGPLAFEDLGPAIPNWWGATTSVHEHDQPLAGGVRLLDLGVSPRSRIVPHGSSFTRLRDLG